ncbi:MAG TPA: hypothetical protein VF763_04225 [Candidatus Limnocylindrales bacterium]
MWVPDSAPEDVKAAARRALMVPPSVPWTPAPAPEAIVLMRAKRDFVFRRPLWGYGGEEKTANCRVRSDDELPSNHPAVRRHPDDFEAAS